MTQRPDDAFFFNDVHVGQTWTSAARVVAQADVFQFAELTGDRNPLHVDPDFARSTPFGRPIAHGLFGLAIVAGLASDAPRMRTLSFLKILEWNFLHPIYFDDRVHVRTEIVAIEPKARGRRGVVTWKRRLINQEEVVVQEGATQTLVEGRPRA